MIKRTKVTNTLVDGINYDGDKNIMVTNIIVTNMKTSASNISIYIVPLFDEVASDDNLFICKTLLEETDGNKDILYFPEIRIELIPGDKIIFKSTDVDANINALISYVELKV